MPPLLHVIAEDRKGMPPSVVRIVRGKACHITGPQDLNELLTSDIKPLQAISYSLEISDAALPFCTMSIKIFEGLLSGLVFRFKFVFKLSYPYDAPKVYCLNERRFHPNIDSDTGAVCLNILRLDWKPVLSIKSVVFGLLLLLYDPSPEDPLDKDAAALLKADPLKFSQIAKSHFLQ
ncbi:hypothetical protein MDAP_001392 [Mitosporidium daphniae]